MLTAHPNVTKWKAILSYLIVSLYLFFEMGVQVSPSVMTRQLMHDMQLGVFGLGLMSGFYFYTYTLMQIPSGLLFDRFAPRNVITLAILVCSIGCLAFGFSNNMWSASLSRLLMGFGSAFAFVAVLVVTADLFSNRYFALITGVTQMLAALGAMAGQMPLSYAVETLGWQHTMWLLAAIGFCLALFVWCLLNYKKDVLTGAQSPAGPATYRFRDILANPQTWWIALYACLLWAPMSGFASLWGVPYLESVFHYSHERAALVCSMMWLGLALASPLLGWVSTVTRTRKGPLAAASLLGALAFAGLLLWHDLNVTMVMLLVLACGAACSGQALSFAVVKEINAPQQRGAAIAFNNMAVVISGAIFQPLLGKLLAQQCEQGVGSSCAVVAYQHSMLLVLGVYVLGAMLALFFIRESYRHH